MYDLVEDLKALSTESQIEMKILMLLEEEAVDKIRIEEGQLYQYEVTIDPTIEKVIQKKEICENWTFSEKQLDDFFEQINSMRLLENGKGKVYRDHVFIYQEAKKVLVIGKRSLSEKALKLQQELG